MKRILILGATGTLGKALVSKLTDSDRYALTLAARHATQHYRDSGNIKVTDCDASSVEELSKVMPGHDVVVCAVSGDKLPIVARSIVTAMKRADVGRLIFMGAIGIYNEIPDEMDGEDNVDNNPDQIPNRDAVEIVENSGLDYTVLRPGYLREGNAEDFVLTPKGEPAKGYITTIPSVINLIVKLIDGNSLYNRQSIGITKDMTASTKEQ